MYHGFLNIIFAGACYCESECESVRYWISKSWEIKHNLVLLKHGFLQHTIESFVCVDHSACWCWTWIIYCLFQSERRRSNYNTVIVLLQTKECVMNQLKFIYENSLLPVSWNSYSVYFHKQQQYIRMISGKSNSDLHLTWIRFGSIFMTTVAIIDGTFAAHF